VSAIRSKIRKRAAAALGVAAFSAITSAAAYDHFADSGMEQIESAVIEAQDLGSEPLEHGSVDWKTHVEDPGLLAATATLESSDGPVRFHFNQSDEISADYFDPGFIPLVDEPAVNTFSERDIRTLTESLDQMASTETGQEMLSKLASEFSGDVQISRLPDDAGASGIARPMVNLHTYAIERDETHDIPRIAISSSALENPRTIGAGLNAQGRRGSGSVASLLMHELAHATHEDARALHTKDEHGYQPVYTDDGQVRDIAMHVENRYRREIAGHDPDAPSAGDHILYKKHHYKTDGEHWLVDSAFEEGRRRAHYERYLHTQQPGFDFHQDLPPVASSLSGLRLSDDEFKTHAGELALDAMLYTGAPINSLDDAPRPSLEEAGDWLEGKGGVDADNAITRRYAHEVESAKRISDYRDQVKDTSIDGVAPIDARIDKALRTNPEKAISLFETAVDPENPGRSIAAARDVLDQNGAYAHTKSFLAEHDKSRRDFALKETLIDIDEGGKFGSSFVKAAARKYAAHSEFFEHGSSMQETRYKALGTKMEADHSFQVAQALPVQAVSRPRRAAPAER
jgi:hypothetical protein